MLKKNKFGKQTSNTEALTSLVKHCQAEQSCRLFVLFLLFAANLYFRLFDATVIQVSLKIGQRYATFQHAQERESERTMERVSAVERTSEGNEASSAE